jgi:hypothetical protein
VRLAPAPIATANPGAAFGRLARNEEAPMGGRGPPTRAFFLTNLRFLFGPMIEQSLAASYGHHLLATTIIAIMSNGYII